MYAYLTSWILEYSILYAYFVHTFNFKFATRWNPYRSLLFCSCRIFSAFFHISVSFWNVEITHRVSWVHSPTFPSLHLHHSSFSNPSVALPTSQLILQPFRCFTYVAAHSPTLLSLLLRHRLFTYVTWRAAQEKKRDGWTEMIVATAWNSIL